MQTPLYYVGPKREEETEIVVDVGNSPVDFFTETIKDGTVLRSSRVVIWVTNEIPDGKSQADVKTEPVRLYVALNDGTMDLTLIGVGAPLSGKYIVRYTVQ